MLTIMAFKKDLEKDQQLRVQEILAKREEKLAEARAAAAEERRSSARPMGSDCEAQVCGACKLVVEEFGGFVLVVRACVA